MIKSVLTRLNRKLLFKERKVFIFVYNATCHPKSATDSFSQRKTNFLAKNTTSVLQPQDAGIIQNFMVNYRKVLVKYRLARVKRSFISSQFIKNVDMLMKI